MDAIILLLGGVLWVACGVVHAGFYNAHFQRKFPNIAVRGRDRLEACVTGCMGPIALLATLVAGFAFRGWSLSADCRRVEDFMEAEARWTRRH